MAIKNVFFVIFCRKFVSDIRKEVARLQSFSPSPFSPPEAGNLKVGAGYIHYLVVDAFVGAVSYRPQIH